MKKRLSLQTLRAFKMSLPIFVELLLQLLVGNVDQIMLSHVAQSSVAAVGNGNQVMTVVIIVLDAMSAATTILMTQYIGAKEENQCGRVCAASFVIVGAFSLAAGVFLLCWPGALFSLLRTPEEAFYEAVLYTRVVGGAVIIQGFYFVFCAALRSFSLLREVMLSA
ncbi:MATE family efflux transporter, partial [Oscillibacter ruminantium]